MKRVYTLQDLEQGDPILSGEKPARLAVIGCPIAHSKSPEMQQAALDAARIPSSYIRIEATSDEFPKAVKLLQDLGFVGANVTIPHKKAAASIAEERDTLTQLTGAANTLVFPRDGAPLAAFNTDGPGFARAIRECFSIDLRSLKIVVLGASGGAGTALAYTCATNRCERLILVARSLEKIQPLARELSPYFIDERRLEGAADRLCATTFSHPDLEELIHDADLIVNATSLGLRQTDPSPISANCILAHHLVYDLVTQSTAFLQEAKEQGARAENGISMLLHQGALAFERWFGFEPSLSAMKRGLTRRL